MVDETRIQGRPYREWHDDIRQTCQKWRRKRKTCWRSRDACGDLEESVVDTKRGTEPMDGRTHGRTDVRFVMFKSCNSRPDFSLNALTVCNSTVASRVEIGGLDSVFKHLCVVVRTRLGDSRPSQFNRNRHLRRV